MVVGTQAQAGVGSYSTSTRDWCTTSTISITWTSTGRRVVVHQLVLLVLHQQQGVARVAGGGGLVARCAGVLVLVPTAEEPAPR